MFLPTAAAARSSYSVLSATMGSTLVARRAGITQAINATTVKRIETATNVNASVGDTPYSSDASTRDSASAAPNPITTPIMVINIP